MNEVIIILIIVVLIGVERRKLQSFEYSLEYVKHMIHTHLVTKSYSLTRTGKKFASWLLSYKQTPLSWF